MAELLERALPVLAYEPLDLLLTAALLLQCLLAQDAVHLAGGTPAAGGAGFAAG